MVNREKTWTAMISGAFGDARKALPGSRSVTRCNARNMRPMRATGNRARHRGSQPDLLIEAVGTGGDEARTCARETGFRNDFASEEGMVSVNARIENRNHRAGSVEASVPGRRRPDERPTLSKRWRVQRVLFDSLDNPA